jgi:hypothetical protein
MRSDGRKKAQNFQGLRRSGEAPIGARKLLPGQESILLLFADTAPEEGR